MRHRLSRELWLHPANSCCSISAGSFNSDTALTRPEIWDSAMVREIFSRTGEFEFAKAKFDDSKWRALNLPHDWAVELPFVRDELQTPDGDKPMQSHGFKPL